MQNNYPKGLFLRPPHALPKEWQPIKHNVTILHSITASSAGCKTHPGQSHCKSNLAFTIRSQKQLNGQLRGQTPNYRNNSSWPVLFRAIPRSCANLRWRLTCSDIHALQRWHLSQFCPSLSHPEHLEPRDVGDTDLQFGFIWDSPNFRKNLNWRKIGNSSCRCQLHPDTIPSSCTAPSIQSRTTGLLLGNSVLGWASPLPACWGYSWVTASLITRAEL